MRVHVKRVGLSGCLVTAGMLASGAAAAGTAMTYHPIRPCRIVDTRTSSASHSPSPLAAGEIRAFDAHGSFFGHQGGSDGACTIPPTIGIVFQGAAAIVVNLVAVGAAGPGDLRVFAGSDAVAPLASVINYVAGQTIAVGTTIPLRTDQIGDDFKIQAAVSGTHVIVDVLGFYSRATTTTFAARIVGIPALAGVVTRFGAVSGVSQANTVRAAVAILLSHGCMVHRFQVRESNPPPTGTRSYTLKALPDNVLLGDCVTDSLGTCQSTADTFVLSNAQAFIEVFNSSGAMPATDATVNFDMTCE